MKSGELWERFKKLNQEQQRELIGYYLGGVGMDVDGWKDSQQRENYPHAKYLETEFEKALEYAEKIVPHINITDSEQMKKSEIPDSETMRLVQHGIEQAKQGKFSKNPPKIDPQWAEEDTNEVQFAREDIEQMSDSDATVEKPWRYIIPPTINSVEYTSKIREWDVEIQFGKVSSSKCPPFHLIPLVALEKLAERFQCGVDRKGDGAWNAISHNQECLTDYKLSMVS